MIVMNIMQMSIEGAILIIVVFTIRFMTLYRLPKVTFLVMWAMILVRLLLPFSIPLHYSFFNVIGHGSWLQSQQTAFVTPHISGFPSVLQMGVQNRIKEPLAGIRQDLIAQIEPLTIIWGVGFLLFAMYFFRKYLHTIRELRLAQPIHANPIIQDWQKKHPLKRKLTILQLDKISTPLTAGIIRPCIILPKGLDLSDQEHLNYILTHEYYHICGFHLLWKYLTITAICIHWFNPLLWLMLMTLNRDLEIACDERLLCHLGADKKVPYSYALIRMAELRSGLTLFSNGFGKNAAEERIKAIMKHKKPTRSTVLAAILLMTLITATVSLRPAVSEVFAATQQYNSVLIPVRQTFTQLDYQVQYLDKGFVCVSKHDQKFYFVNEQNSNLKKNHDTYYMTMINGVSFMKIGVLKDLGFAVFDDLTVQKGQQRIALNTEYAARVVSIDAQSVQEKDLPDSTSFYGHKKMRNIALHELKNYRLEDVNEMGYGSKELEEYIKANYGKTMQQYKNENLIRMDLKYPHPLRCEYTLLDNGQVLVTIINDNRSTYIEVAKEIRDQQIYVER